MTKMNKNIKQLNEDLIIIDGDRKEGCGMSTIALSIVNGYKYYMGKK